MKKLMLIIAVSMVSFLHAATTFTTAVEYNNFIIDEQVSIVEKQNRLFEVMNADVLDAKLARQLQKEFAKQCDLSISKIKQIGAFDGNLEFKKACLSLFNCYKQYAKQGLPKIISIFENPKRTEADIDRFNKIQDEYELSCSVCFALLEEVQAAFAAKHNFTIDKN